MIKTTYHVHLVGVISLVSFMGEVGHSVGRGTREVLKVRALYPVTATPCKKKKAFRIIRACVYLAGLERHS